VTRKIDFPQWVWGKKKWFTHRTEVYKKVEEGKPEVVAGTWHAGVSLKSHLTAKTYELGSSYKGTTVSQLEKLEWEKGNHEYFGKKLCLLGQKEKKTASCESENERNATSGRRWTFTRHSWRKL